MSNSNKDKSEESTKNIENVDAESINESIDSTSNKKTRFTKSKSISEVFKELEINEDSDKPEKSFSADSEDIVSDLEGNDLDLGSGIDSIDSDSEEADEIIPIHNEYPESIDSEEADESFDSDSEDEIDEIIPIHNEYDDLDKSEAFDNDVIDEHLNSSKPEDIESNVKGSFDEDSLENKTADSSQFDEEGLVIINPDDNSRKGKRNASSKSIKDAKAKQSTKSSFNLMDTSFLFTLLGLIVGIGILVMGILYYSSSSDRVVDNVLSGETAGLAIFIIIKIFDADHIFPAYTVSALQQMHRRRRHLGSIFRSVTDDQQIIHGNIESEYRIHHRKRTLHRYPVRIQKPHQHGGAVTSYPDDRKFLCRPVHIIIQSHPDHVRRPEKRFGAAFRDHTDLIRRVIIIIGKIPSLYDRLAGCVLQPRHSHCRRSLKSTSPAGKASPKAPIRRHCLHMRNFLKDRFNVFVCKINLDPLLVLSGSVYINLPAGDGVQLTVDPSLDTVTDGNDQDNGGNTNNDTQHCK